MAVALAALTVGVAWAVPGSSAAPVPNVNWVTLLPPLPTPNNPQPHAVPYCRYASKHCITTEVRRLRALRGRLGCNHRAVFATTYLTLTKKLRQMLRRDPHLVKYHRYLYFEDALFADLYFRTTRAWTHGGDVPDAWRTAFTTAAHGNANAAQDMLLGINAHVQNDMPYVIAALGMRTRSGKSRKPDHDAINAVLNQAYEPVVHAIRDRYDPFLDLTNSDLTPLDDVAGLEVVRTWREVVWRNAERLSNAKTQAERRQVAASIESYANGWATTIANANLDLPPGYRAQRDAYCKAHN